MRSLFVLVSAVFSVLAVFPLVYLALRSAREARELRLIQLELAGLVREGKAVSERVHSLQQEIQREQLDAKRSIDKTKRSIDETKRTVAQVTATVEHIAEAGAAQGTVIPRRPRRRLRALASALGSSKRGVDEPGRSSTRHEAMPQLAWD